MHTAAHTPDMPTPSTDADRALLAAIIATPTSAIASLGADALPNDAEMQQAAAQSMEANEGIQLLTAALTDCS